MCTLHRLISSPSASDINSSGEVMLRVHKILSTFNLVIASVWLVASEASAEATYSCYFPTKCTAPDGGCGLASVRKEFSSRQAISSQQQNGNRIFLLSDLSVIYIQENNKTNGCNPSDCVKAALAEFLDDDISSISTSHGVCQIGDIL